MPAPTLENLIAWSAQVFVVVTAGATISIILRIHRPKFHLFFCYTLLSICIALPWIQPLRQAVKPAAAPLAEAGAAMPGFATAMVEGLASVRALLVWILIAGVVIRFSFFLAGVLRISHYRKSAIPLHFPKESILSVCKLLNSEVEIAVSAHEVGPVTFGCIGPMILLPASFLSLDEGAQRAILCHELLHVVRRDWLSNIIEEVIAAGLWFHPGIWWLLSQTKLAREQVVDEEVVRLTSERDSYICALLAIAGGSGEGSLAPAPLFLRRRHLTTRMRSLLQEERRTSSARLALSFASLVAAMCCVVLAGFTAFPLTAAVRERDNVVQTSVPQLEAPLVSWTEDGVMPPRITTYVAPEYSDAAREAKVEGIVVAEALIQADGTVGSIAVKRSLHPDLDRNAVYALQQWRFEAGRRNGVAVDQKMFIEISFRLKR